MKNFVAIIIGSCICAAATLGGMWYFAKNMTFQAETVAVRGTSAVNPDSFKLSNERIVSDLQNRFVVIPPIGQMWGFTPDQKVTIEVLQTRATEDGVIVAVKLTSHATVQPPTTPPPTPTPMTAGSVGNTAPAPAPPPALPVSVTLSGVAKLQYEQIAGEWYLLDVVSVNLRATQK